MLATLLDRVGIKEWTLELNSVGCPADRARFNGALRTALEPVTAQMWPTASGGRSHPCACLTAVPRSTDHRRLPRIGQFLDEAPPTLREVWRSSKT
jgi:hypothetical protein